MTSEELTAQLQSLKAQTLATQFVLQAVLEALPPVAATVRARMQTYRDVLLHTDATDQQLAEMEKTVRLVAGGCE